MSLFRFDSIHVHVQGQLTFMKTFTATPDDISHDWHVVDAEGMPLGRLASDVAQHHPRQAQADLHARTWTPATTSS